MDKQYFLELLYKHLNGEATDVEQQFLVKYYELFQAEPDIVALLVDEQKETLKNEIKASVWQNIEGDNETHKKIVHIKPWFLKMVAAAVIIGVCATGFLFLRNHPGNKSAHLYSVRKQNQNLFIVLPDGSRAILSYGSKLSYASSFDGLAKRDVYLEGQAFFDIRHDDLKPFIVHTGKLETTVLGTAFNVKALKGDKTITVTVTRGRVKVTAINSWV
jgi:transmembrane sensor